MASFKFKFSRPKGLNISGYDRFLAVSFIIWFLLTASELVIVFLLKNKLPPEIPLFYSRIWGEARLAKKELLFLLPLGNLFLGVFNLGYSYKLQNKEIFLARILQIITVVISVLSLLAVVNIINLMQ